MGVERFGKRFITFLQIAMSHLHAGSWTGVRIVRSISYTTLETNGDMGDALE